MNVAGMLKAKGRAVTTAKPETTLLEISTKLAAKRIGAIIVVAEGGRIAGIISERDVIRTVAERGAAALTVPVGEVMTRDVVTCSESQTIEDLMEIMTRGRFRHCPVVDDGALVGIISIGDVVKYHTAEVELEVSAMRDYLATG
jgi:CBS domain-containing protein